MRFICPYEAVFIPVEISGDENTVVVKVNGFLTSDEFYSLIGFLRERRYWYRGASKYWIKRVSDRKELEFEMNELENFLLDCGISFVNLHPMFLSLVNSKENR